MREQGQTDNHKDTEATASHVYLRGHGPSGRYRGSYSATIFDELRERITPGQLVDQAVDYARDSGGGMFVRNLGRQTTANPLPVALAGLSPRRMRST